MHLFGLPDAVHPSHGLQVRLGVPVAVEENARVGGLEVHPEAAGPRRHEECKEGRARRVEGVDVHRPLHAVRPAVKPTEFVLLQT